MSSLNHPQNNASHILVLPYVTTRVGAAWTALPPLIHTKPRQADCADGGKLPTPF